MATGRELEEVERVDRAGLNAGDVAEALDKLGAVVGRVVYDQGAAALAVPAASELALAGAQGPRLLDLLKVGTSTDRLQQTQSSRGLGQGSRLADSRVDNQGNFGNRADPVTAGEQERGNGRGSEGGGGGEAPGKKGLARRSAPNAVSAMSSPHRTWANATYFWPWLTLMCHFRQTLVGANMRPDRHMLPKAA